MNEPLVARSGLPEHPCSVARRPSRGGQARRSRQPKPTVATPTSHNTRLVGAGTGVGCSVAENARSKGSRTSRTVGVPIGPGTGAFATYVPLGYAEGKTARRYNWRTGGPGWLVRYRTYCSPAVSCTSGENVYVW